MNGCQFQELEKYLADQCLWNLELAKKQAAKVMPDCVQHILAIAPKAMPKGLASMWPSALFIEHVFLSTFKEDQAKY